MSYTEAMKAQQWWIERGVKPTIIRVVKTANFTTKSTLHHEMVQIGHTKYYYPYNMQKGGVFWNLYRIINKNGDDYVIHKAK